MKIFSGSSNKPLAEKIAKELGTSLSPLELHVFPDGETRVRVLEKVLNEDAVVVEPTSLPVDHNYMELFFIVDALKRSGAKTVTAVIPYLGYQRQDHIFRDGEAVSLQVIVETLEAVGVDRIISFDFHTIRVPELFHIPVKHLSALALFSKEIQEIIRGPVRRFPPAFAKASAGRPASAARPAKLEERSGVGSPSTPATPHYSDTVLISPDRGGVRRIKILSEMLNNISYAVIEKNRDLATGNISSEVIEGEVRKQAIIVDDMISSGGTIKAAASLLREQGAEEIYVFATHAVFSAEAKETLENSLLRKIFVTDSVYLPEKKRPSNLEIISLAKTIAQSLLKL